MFECVPAHVGTGVIYKKPVGVCFLSLPNIKKRISGLCWTG
jgi:hypothetical protein